MSETTGQDLSGVAETLLLTLYIRAMESQVKSLVLMLRDHFPGAELVIDIFSPFLIWMNNEWGYFNRLVPRLAHIRWMRHVPLLAGVLRLYHYRLGEAVG